MKIIQSPKEMQALTTRLRKRGKTIGFVPTMGALHEGHLSLVRSSKRQNDFTVVSIFVNPTQFGPKEDFTKYPRPLRKDLNLLGKEKVDFVFHPTVEAMYPPLPNPPPGGGRAGWGCLVEVDPKLANVLCGRSRPGHFEGVATVVAKLFDVVRPHRAYFGQKDYQQTAVIRYLVRRLRLKIKLGVLPIVREADGLAMSSRNIYLNKEERKRARVISETLFWFQKEIYATLRKLAPLKREALRRLRKQVTRVDYFEVVDPETLVPLKKIRPQMVALAACFLGKTRLIDNVRIKCSRARS